MKILIVEDNSGVLRAMELALSMNHEVEVAATGRDALDKYHDARAVGEPFHALLLDVNLPGDIGGFGIARAARLRGDNETRLIFLSAEVGDEGAETAMELGGIWLQKPEDMGRIEAALR